MHRRSIALAFFAHLVACSGASAAEGVDFDTQILPLLSARCVKCHGPDKQSGRLRLDTAAEITATAKDTLLGGGDAEKSELLRRILLPAKNPKRMPKGADPLPAEEIALIRQWIEGGAALTSVEAPATDAAEAEEAAEHVAEPTPPRVPTEEDPELASLPPASADAIKKIEAAGGVVMPLFGESPLLQVSFAQAASPPGDDAIAALADAADNIVWLNLAKAQVSANGLAALSQLKNLIQVHLEQSNVDDAGLDLLAKLPRLEYLNLYDTAVTDVGISKLKGLAKLRNLYVWQTKVSWDASVALQSAIPGLEVNLGWDHPEVAKRRMTKELKSAKQMAAAAATHAAALEQQFTAAKQGKEQAEARVKELEEQLKALEKPSADESADGGATDAEEQGGDGDSQ